MTDQLELHITLPEKAIRAYCQRWGICELALFGSVLREDFTEQSDADVLLTFAPGIRPTLFDLAQMGDELEAILGRRVDLLTRNSVERSQNYIRRKAILNSAQVVYAEG